ncbi:MULTISPECIES: nitrogenase component 1 [unclassified Lentimonas]|uniref:nitrogenase component 1 n=1 Tax=unclassified Lentimonas TaxID=2630993 RepID=UPI0013245328|nr:MULTISPECIES: nitrogenase component 1 [unclassified Lentimonas]CAA6694975.1 Nitrogenase FeMo-cofactor scaffold and assembly protein NifN [Lentimonas sp. CC19]CAA6695324.1 Nitrogenase FeMo-cofactor scaffold and assembly protein NifN [Lentimonas sp. CC10]CAA7072007.1 Nitrogenase FeMo-cofactor scaffold and assembly protein NifN [Lentimonas sp. CC11]
MIVSNEDLDTTHYESGATCNACKLCTPLGACMVYAGIEKCIPILHGSQGCSTYIRRYMISHFREPVDIASSSFTEADTVYGGARNLALGIKNLIEQYSPAVIGVGTTCLSETIGEDIGGMVKEIERGVADEAGVPLVHVSTPSYTGTHTDGFHAACLSLVKRFSEGTSHQEDSKLVNMFPGMVSPEDLRYYNEILEDLALDGIMIPDYSDTLDGVSWGEYHRIPEGGTTLESLKLSGTAKASIECGSLLAKNKETAGRYLEETHQVKNYALPLPVGIRATDAFIEALESLAGHSLSKRLADERGRLVDSMFDAHKYLFGKKVAVYGDPDLVVGIVALISEMGMVPVVCATGGKVPHFRKEIDKVLQNADGEAIEILTSADHVRIHDRCEERKPDLIIGSSKGYSISRKTGIPIVRVGFPVHDRMGGQRLLHVGYRGAQQLFDRIVNTILEHKQAQNDVGYTYL